MPRMKKQHLKKRPDGRYRCKYDGHEFYGATEEEAFAARDEYKKAQSEGMTLSSSMTLAQYATSWLPVAHPAVSDATYRGLATHLDHLLAHIGSLPVTDVRPLHIKEVYSADYVGLSQSYITGARQLYVALFDSLVENGLIRTNPAKAKDAQPHRGTVGSHRAITEEERYWITHYCLDHRAHAAVMAMLYAGIRPQEMKALDIDRSVNFTEGTISLVDFAHRDGMYRYKITSTGKTDKARRTIPLLDPLRVALAGKHGPIITNADGSPINVQGWKCVWKSYVFHMEKEINGCEKRWYGKTKEHKAILASGGPIPPWKDFTVVPYDLRHSFCTMCRDHGVELNTCIRWMGHADSKMILKIYDSVSDTRSRREAMKLNTALLAADPSPGSTEPEMKKTINS